LVGLGRVRRPRVGPRVSTPGARGIQWATRSPSRRHHGRDRRIVRADPHGIAVRRTIRRPVVPWRRVLVIAGWRTCMRHRAQIAWSAVAQRKCRSVSADGAPRDLVELPLLLPVAPVHERDDKDECNHDPSPSAAPPLSGCHPWIIGYGGMPPQVLPIPSLTKRLRWTTHSSSSQMRVRTWTVEIERTERLRLGYPQPHPAATARPGSSNDDTQIWSNQLQEAPERGCLPSTTTSGPVAT